MMIIPTANRISGLANNRPEQFDLPARRALASAAECTEKYKELEASAQQSCKSKCEGYIKESESFKLIAGVDEVGRGPLAGPVIGAAVILGDESKIAGIADSKTLSAARRNILAAEIKASCIDWALGRADVNEIDALNISQATLLAMQRALEKLRVRPMRVLIDGQQFPQISFAVISMQAVIDGDNLIDVVSAASIIAKVARDAEMVELDKIYPTYGFAQHKGYGTKQHLAALKQFGASPIHRRSFRPVQEVCER